MKAVILAGGKGTRLRPYTTVLPKPLMPVCGVPVLEILLRQLVRHEFLDAIITVGHLAKLIQVYFGDGSQYGVRIQYSEESKPLGTMGPLKLIHDLPENFLVLNGDVLTDFSFSEFFHWHCKNENIFSIASYRKELDTNLGVLETGADNYLTGFREKPKLAFEGSMGIYAANRAILDYIPDDEPFGFDDLMLKLLACGRPARVYQHRGRWVDIGLPTDFEAAQKVYQELKDEAFQENS